MSAARARHGLAGSGAAHHLVFSGHPGTGKTAVARVLGKVFAGAGLLARGHLVEAHRVDLIGQYVGHTAVKTNELIDSALDGVLFIDEAYGLHGGYEGSTADAFGDEALQILLKRAEDDRHGLWSSWPATARRSPACSAPTRAWHRGSPPGWTFPPTTPPS